MFTVIIPARFDSRRLPKKLLADICGKPMIIRVIEKVQMSGAHRIIIASDNIIIYNLIKKLNYDVCMTSSIHTSGIERLGEVIDKYKLPNDDIIVNVQADEPLIPPQIISQIANLIKLNNANIATLATPIYYLHEIFNPNIVKLVINKNNYALYFSRAPIPWDRNGFLFSKTNINNHFLRHIGIYAYKASFIRRYIKWPKSTLENIEMLEQLRIMWYGEKIYVNLADVIPGPGVDTKEDLELVRKIFKKSYY